MGSRPDAADGTGGCSGGITNDDNERMEGDDDGSIT